MPLNVQITCDFCGEDITATDEMPKFRLKLSTEKLQHNSRTVNAVWVYPPIESDKYFCGIKCLTAWLANKAMNSDQNNSGEN